MVDPDKAVAILSPGMIGGTWPVETKVRAFGLYMDWAKPSQIAELVGVPQETVKGWIRSRMDMDGRSLSWKDIRDISMAVRALASSERSLAKVERFDYEEYVKDFTEDTSADLQRARKTIMDALTLLDDRGNLQVKPSLGQLPKIIEAELLLQGKATKIVEDRRNVTFMVAQIVSKHAQHMFPQDKARIFLDRVGEDFALLLATGGDTRAVDKIINIEDATIVSEEVRA